MITEQRQESIVRPFQMLMSQFETELDVASNTLTEWNKARSISASSVESPDNDELIEKIRQLEQGKSELVNFLGELMARLKLGDNEFDTIVESIRVSYKEFILKLGKARSFLNYRYTVLEKNEINRRITAVNSSSMLNNADMEGLQHQWRNILMMENDRKLLTYKNIFESRLSDWENLIAQKKGQ